MYFFNHPVLKTTNQAALLSAINSALTTAQITGILFGVRHGSSQKIETSVLDGGVKVQMINIVMDTPIPTGRDKSGARVSGGPPPIDLV